MRRLILGVALLSGTTLFAQSKKELAAEVAALKAQIVELKTQKVMEFKDLNTKACYGLGVLVAQNLKSQGGDSLDVEAINAGVADVFANKTLRIEQSEIMPLVQQYMQAAMEQKALKMKDESAAFLENNKKSPDVKVTASGLQYKVLKAGTGKTPKASDNVTVHYVGTLVDGTEFDSSVKRNEPATFQVGGVIPGWTEALQLMHEGDKWTLYIPFDLAYGERGAGEQIPPYATLIFEVELLKVN